MAKDNQVLGKFRWEDGVLAILWSSSPCSSRGSGQFHPCRHEVHEDIAIDVALAWRSQAKSR